MMSIDKQIEILLPKEIDLTLMNSNTHKQFGEFYSPKENKSFRMSVISAHMGTFIDYKQINMSPNITESLDSINLLQTKIISITQQNILGNSKLSIDTISKTEEGMHEKMNEISFDLNLIELKFGKPNFVRFLARIPLYQ